MKGRIGKYKDKIVVWGDPNLTAKNEINIDSLGEGGEQSNTPVEYYKVIALEGEDLNSTRYNVFSCMSMIITDKLSCFHVVIKGTSPVNGFKLFAGLLLSSAMAFDSQDVHAYAIRSFKVICKVVNQDGTITEIPSFNNIFDAMESIEEIAEMLPFIKKHLVPITAEEFYNLDDLK